MSHLVVSRTGLHLGACKVKSNDQSRRTVAVLLWSDFPSYLYRSIGKRDSQVLFFYQANKQSIIYFLGSLYSIRLSQNSSLVKPKALTFLAYSLGSFSISILFFLFAFDVIKLACCGFDCKCFL